MTAQNLKHALRLALCVVLALSLTAVTPIHHVMSQEGVGRAPPVFAGEEWFVGIAIVLVFLLADAVGCFEEEDANVPYEQSVSASDKRPSWREYLTLFKEPSRHKSTAALRN